MKIIFKKGVRAGESQTFNPPGIFIGRAPDNDITFENDSVSQYHAEISQKNKKWYIKDCNSSNGIKINGKKIADITKLHSADLIYIGTEVIQVKFAEIPSPSHEDNDSDLAIKIRGPQEKKKHQDIPEIIEEPEEVERPKSRKKNTKSAETDAKHAKRRLMHRMVNQELTKKRNRLRKISISIAIIANIAILLWWLSKKGYIDLTKIDWSSIQF